MIAFIGVVSLFVFIIFGVMFVWSLIKKNRKAKRNILISGISFVLMIFLVVIDSDASDFDEFVDETLEVEEETEKEKVEKEKAEKEKAKKEKAEKEKAEKEKAKKEKNKNKEKSDENNIHDFVREKESHENISDENVLIDEITTQIENGILTIKFRSFNKSGDLAVLDGLVTVTAEQSNDFLDEAFDLYDSSSENSYSHWIEDSTSYVMEAQYKIRNVRDPIEIMFVLYSDEDWTEEIIELNFD